MNIPESTLQNIPESTLENALHMYASKLYTRITTTNDKLEYMNSLKEAKNILRSDIDFGCLDIAVSLKGGRKQRQKFEHDPYLDKWFESNNI